MIIAISSVTKECSVYASNGEKETYIHDENTDMVITLPILAEKAIRTVGGDIDTVIVSDGPGYFTGTRIGLSFAKGLAVGRMNNICILNSLDVLAFKSGRKGEISVLLKARKGVYHFRRYNNNGDLPAALTEQQMINESDVISYVHDTIVIGEGIKYLPASVLDSIQYENIFYPDAKHMYSMYRAEGMDR